MLDVHFEDISLALCNRRIDISVLHYFDCTGDSIKFSPKDNIDISRTNIDNFGKTLHLSDTLATARYYISIKGYNQSFFLEQCSVLWNQK